MKVSIVIPCYRQGRYLRTAVDSCLAQTYRDVEVIVVNDGSDDETDEVARSYGGRIRYVHKTNGGLCAARNSGIAVAAGRYFKFVDADDHLCPNQIAWHMEGVKGRQDVISVTTLRAYRDEDPRQYTDLVPDFRALLPDMFRQPDSAPHAWLFPADLIAAVNRFDEAIAITGDWNILCRIGRLRPKVHCDTRVGGYYRLRLGSMSTDRSGMTLEVARQLIALHDELRMGPDREWFGPELLGAEQRTYRRMLLGSRREVELERQLLCRIRELRGVVRHDAQPSGGRKFETLCRVLGYSMAEKIYAKYVKVMRRLPRGMKGEVGTR